MAVALTITKNGNDYGFDFEDSRIDVDANVENLNVGELYTAIQDAQDDVVAMPYAKIANASGRDTLVTGVRTFLTVSLLGVWEVNTLRTSGKFTVSGGNLIRLDGEDPFRDNPLITYINLLSQAGVLVTDSGGSVPTATEVADAVWAKELP